MATTESGMTNVPMLAKFTVSSWAVATTSNWAGPFGSPGWQAVANAISARKPSSRRPYRTHQLCVDERITRGLVKTSVRKLNVAKNGEPWNAGQLHERLCQRQPFFPAHPNRHIVSRSQPAARQAWWGFLH